MNTTGSFGRGNTCVNTCHAARGRLVSRRIIARYFHSKCDLNTHARMADPDGESTLDPQRDVRQVNPEEAWSYQNDLDPFRGCAVKPPGIRSRAPPPGLYPEGWLAVGVGQLATGPEGCLGCQARCHANGSTLSRAWRRPPQSPRRPPWRHTPRGSPYF